MGNFCCNINNFDTDFENYIIIDKNVKLVVGTWKNPNPESDLSRQGISIDGSIIYSLKYSIKMANELVVYNFDNNIRLTFKKTNNTINYELKYNDVIISKDVDIECLKRYQKIGKNSNEIDYILSFID
jgi:hypothetical protein